MFKDYHYLARCAFELKNILLGETIVSAFTQDKNRMFLHIPLSGQSLCHLEISIDSRMPFLLLRKEFHRARKNTFNLFESSLPAKVEDVRIAIDDRVIKFSTNLGDFFVLVRGGGSNIIYLSAEGIISGFKKIKDEESLQVALINMEFINSAEDILFNSRIDFTSHSTVKKIAPYISKKLFFEVNRRSGEIDLATHYKQCVDEIMNSQISVALDNESSVAFRPVSFGSEPLNNANNFSSFSNAISHYIAIVFKYERFTTLRKLVLSAVEKELGRLSSKLNNLTTRVKKGCRDNEYYKKANLLLVNLKSVIPNSDLVELDDILTGDRIRIVLDRKLNVQENANKYFEKAKDEKKNYAASAKLLEQTKIKYETYINFRNKILETVSIDELKYIKDQLNIKDPVNKAKVDTERINCHKFLLDGKYTVVVGRDSKSNDMLTVKLAKQNDYWFHARGMPGSHVVLRVDNPKEAVPKSVLNATASIAAFYSKAKTAKLVPVAYTLRKFVRKNKAMNTGQVLLSKEKVLLVKPEIPKIAEFIEE